MRSSTLSIIALGMVVSATQAETTELTIWHHLASEAELNAITASINRFNRSQNKWKIVQDTVFEGSYTQIITAAGKANVLPCMIDLDQPLVPYFVWNGFLRPLDGMIDDVLHSINTSGKGVYKGKTYSAGQFDAALALFTRKSLLEQIKARTPTIEQPWTKDEFMQVLEKIKVSGNYAYPFDMRVGDRTEWISYAFAPLMLSWGADLINRDNYVQVDGVLNSGKAIAFGKWLQLLVREGYIEANPADDKGLLNGRVAIQYNGSWATGEYDNALGDDLAILPVPDFGNGPIIGGGSWHWAITESCAYPEGAKAFMQHLLSPSEMAAMSEATSLIPTSFDAAQLTTHYGKSGKWRIFYEFTDKFSKLRPETPVYSVISSSYKSAISDILDGMDPRTSLGIAVENIEAAIERHDGYKMTSNRNE